MRDELTAEYGVTIYDRDNEWFVGGGFSRGGSVGEHRHPDARPNVHQRIGAYARAADDFEEVDVRVVEAMLDERSRMRERRDFDGADAMRDRLQAEHGVVVSDKEWEWHVGGSGRGGRDRRGGDKSSPHATARDAMRGVRGNERYSGERRDGRSPHAAERDAMQSWSTGERGMHEEGMYEDEDTGDENDWSPPSVGPMSAALRVQTPYGILGHDYERLHADDQPLSADDFEPINGLLAARVEAKRYRRYDEADELLAMLNNLGVTVDDQAKMWRADGQPFDPTVWTRIAGDGDVNAGDAYDDEYGDSNIIDSNVDVDVPAVEALIASRGEAKKVKDYETADALATQLRSEYKVVLDDKRRTWRVVVEFGGYYRVGPKVDPFTTKQVGDLLERRTEHKLRKEYEEADAIHAELTEMGIVLDTRTCTWKRPAARVRPPR